MRVLLFALLFATEWSGPALADPLEISGRFLIESDTFLGSSANGDSAGTTLDGAWLVDDADLRREALIAGRASDPLPFASAFTVSRDGADLYGESYARSRVTGTDAAAGGSDIIRIEAFSPNPRSAGGVDRLTLVLAGPSDWFETTDPGQIPDLSRATSATILGENADLAADTGSAVLERREGRALGPLALRSVAPQGSDDAQGRLSEEMSVGMPDARLVPGHGRTT